MKGTLSLAIAILVAALAVSVPAAFADPGLDGAPDMSATQTPDWFERAAAAAERRNVSAPYVDAFERPPAVSTQTTSSTVDSGTSIAWEQIGIAFGIGLLLALGLMLAVRSRPSPPVAQ